MGNMCCGRSSEDPKPEPGKEPGKEPETELPPPPPPAAQPNQAFARGQQSKPNQAFASSAQFQSPMLYTKPKSSEEDSTSCCCAAGKNKKPGLFFADTHQGAKEPPHTSGYMVQKGQDNDAPRKNDLSGIKRDDTTGAKSPVGPGGTSEASTTSSDNSNSSSGSSDNRGGTDDTSFTSETSSSGYSTPGQTGKKLTTIPDPVHNDHSKRIKKKMGMKSPPSSEKREVPANMSMQKHHKGNELTQWRCCVKDCKCGESECPHNKGPKRTKRVNQLDKKSSVDRNRKRPISHAISKAKERRVNAITSPTLAHPDIITSQPDMARRLDARRPQSVTRDGTNQMNPTSGKQPPTTATRSTTDRSPKQHMDRNSKVGVMTSCTCIDSCIDSCI